MSVGKMFMCAAAVVSLGGAYVAQSPQPSAQDKAFVREAMSGGIAEVRLGQYASANAASAERPQVR